MGGVALAASPGERAVLRLIRERGALTRGDIGGLTGLSHSQVSRLTAELIGRGLVEVDDRVGARTGRPSDLLGLGRRSRFVAGVDVGGGARRAVVANLRGEVVASRTEPQPPVGEPGAVVAGLADLVVRVLAEAGVVGSALLGLGVGLYAVVDPVDGKVLGWTESSGWASALAGFGLAEALRERLGIERVTVDDTVRLLAIAEARHGLGASVPDFAFVFADSGVGAALVFGGTPYVSSARLAGEIGHVNTGAGDSPCPCGKRGCLEAEASTTALVRRAAGWLPRGGEQPAIDTLLGAAIDGDERAMRLLSEAGERLGTVLAVVLSLLFPPLVVVGGSLAGSEAFLAATRRTAAAGAHPRAGEGFRLERSSLGPLAGALGAATSVLDEAFEPESRAGARRGRQPVGPVPSGGRLAVLAR